MEMLQDKRLWVAILAIIVILFAANAAGLFGGDGAEINTPTQQETTTQ